MTTTLADLDGLVRSKNAGPFWLTIDIFIHDQVEYVRVVGSTLTDPVALAGVYNVDPGTVQVFILADLQAVKISFPRPIEQGSLHERDLHAGQQYVPLLRTRIPELIDSTDALTRGDHYLAGR